MQKITAGMEFAGYRLVKQIGVGSAGEVWRGTNGRQTVAAKFLNTTLLESPDRKKHLFRFKNEALALQHVSDLVHIPTHIHHDLEVERPYIIMQFIESAPFSDLIANGELMYVPLPVRLNALQRIAETLSIVHKRGIVHRDIKPSNMHGLDHPYLLDFSIGIPSRASESEQIDRRVGTPLYLTPDLLPPSDRTDSYAFTIVVYEMLFGRHPIFDYRHVPDNSDELRKQAGHIIMEETWKRPDQLNETDLPVNLQGADLERLTRIFQNGLMLSDDRYADVLVFMNDVLEAIHIPDNLEHLDKLPLPTDDVGAEQLTDVEHFTDHLVEVYSASTDLPESQGIERLGTTQWIIGLSVVFGVIFLVLVLLVMSPN